MIDVPKTNSWQFEAVVIVGISRKLFISLESETLMPTTNKRRAEIVKSLK